MHDIMVKPLPPGCRLTAIFDASRAFAYHLSFTDLRSQSCHSGSALGEFIQFWAIIAHSDGIITKIYHILCVNFNLAHDISWLISSQYSTEGKVKEPNLALEAGQDILTAASSYARGDMGGVFQSVTGFVRSATSGRSAQQKARQTKTSAADVVRTLLCLRFQVAQIAFRYLGAGAKTRRQVQMLLKLVPLPAP